jgi:hypothetical protein
LASIINDVRLAFARLGLQLEKLPAVNKWRLAVELSADKTVNAVVVSCNLTAYHYSRGTVPPQGYENLSEHALYVS